MDEQLDKQMWRVHESRRQQETQAQVRYHEASKRRLLRILEKKLTTAFIGALARFETYFGQLWGHRKDDSQLSENERAWRARWETARTEVLNNGNNQLRAVQSELAQYIVNWERHNLVLSVGEPTAEEEGR